MSWTARRPRYQDVLAQEGKRFCSNCKSVRNLDEFLVCPTNKHGRSRYCITCKPDKALPDPKTKELTPNEVLFKLGFLWCPDCKKPRPVDEFYINNASRFGRTRLCKECDDISRTIRDKNQPIERKKAKTRARRKAIDEERDAMGIRNCRRCKKTKPHEAFKKDASKTFGIQRICKDCDNLWSNERRVEGLLKLDGFSDDLIKKFIRRFRQAKFVQSCEMQEQQKQKRRQFYLQNRDHYIEKAKRYDKSKADHEKIRFYNRLRELGFFPKEICHRAQNG